MRTLVFVILSLSLIPLLACAPGNGGEDAGSDGGDAAFDVYQPGMVKQGDSLKFVLVEAVPGAPVPVDDNVWTVRLSDEDGEPAAGLSVWLTPFMPDHDHGTSPPDFAGVEAASAGEYTLEPFVLPMPGYWEFTLSAEDDGTFSDEVLFRFNVEG